MLTNVQYYLYLDRRVCTYPYGRILSTRRRLWSDRDQIWHMHADSSRHVNGLNKNYTRLT